MQLTDSILKDFHAFGQRVSLQRTSHEKRRAHRFNFFRAATVPKNESNPPLIVMIRDISASGVCFSCDEEMPVGEEFILNLPRLGGKPPLPAKCIVNRCESGGTGGSQFVIGASFQKLLDEPLTAAATKSSK